MAILFQDGFAQYNSLDAFMSDKGGAWHNAKPIQLSYNTALYGGAEIRVNAWSPSQAVASDLYIDDLKFVAMSFFMRMPSTSSQRGMRIGFSPRPWRLDRLSSASGSAPIAFEFSTTSGGVPSVIHNVPTAAAPSVSMNSLSVASGAEPLAANQVYHVQMMIDIRNPVGVFRVLLNGVVLFDATFNRDRLANGFQPLGVGSIIISSTSSGGQNVGISDLVAWLPDSEHPFPSPKPLKIRYYAPSATLATPADESTFVLVNTDTYANYAIPAGSVPATAEIIGARAYVRMRAQDGASFANADVKLSIGGSDEQIVLEQIPSGFLSKLFSKQLTTAQASVAAINAAIFKMRSPE